MSFRECGPAISPVGVGLCAVLGSSIKARTERRTARQTVAGDFPKRQVRLRPSDLLLTAEPNRDTLQALSVRPQL